MITSVRLFVIFTVAAHWFASASFGGVAVRTTLTPGQIRPGQHAVLEIRIDADRLSEEANLRGGHFNSLEALTGALEHNDELLFRAPGIQILEQSFDKEDADLVWKYELTTYTIGKFRVPPLEFKIASLTLSSEGKALEVATTRPDEDNSMRPLYDEERQTLPWFWLFMASLVASFLFLFSRIFELQPIGPRTASTESPEQWLRTRLAILEHELASKAGREEFVLDALGATVKEYLTRRTGKSVVAWTTQELLRSELYGPVTAPLTQWLGQADRHKFAQVPLESTDFVRDGLETVITLLGKHRELR